MKTESQESLNSLKVWLKDRAFFVYAFWFRRQLTKWVSGELEVSNKILTLKRVSKSNALVLDVFLSTEVDDKDLRFAGVGAKGLNLGHPSFVYFGIFDNDDLIALAWMRILGRRKIERLLLVGRSWRRRGLRSNLLVRNGQICKNHRLISLSKIDVNNEVMLNIYKKKGYKLDNKEGHLYIFEEKHE